MGPLKDLIFLLPVPPPKNRRSPRRPAQDALRPGWLLNCLLFAALVTAIGACYVWLDSRKKEREAQILAMHREIRQYEDQIKENALLMNRRLSPEALRARAARAGLGLKPIEIGPHGRLVRLPEPRATSELESSPVIAGNPQP